MEIHVRRSLFAGSLIATSVLTSAAQTQAPGPDALAAPGETLVATVHAEGAQIYECKADASGRAVWQFREPIATLLQDGRTIGRHYAGPSWEHVDGSAVVGKTVARAAGVSAKDIPWLKLEITNRRGIGMLSGVTTVQRVNTQGGAADGPCDKVGTYLSVVYAAEYVFLRK